MKKQVTKFLAISILFAGCYLQQDGFVVVSLSPEESKKRGMFIKQICNENNRIKQAWIEKRYVSKGIFTERFEVIDYKYNLTLVVEVDTLLETQLTLQVSNYQKPIVHGGARGNTLQSALSKDELGSLVGIIIDDSLFKFNPCEINR